MAAILEAFIDSFFYPGTKMPALSQIHLTIEQGDFVIITGPAGCGKTTLCYSLAGVIPKSVTGVFHGTVKVADRDLAGMPLPQIGPLVGLVIQSPENQLFNVTVAEDVAFGPENLKFPADEVRARVKQALDFTGSAHLADRFSHLLSGGQSQRVVLSSVLALGAEVYVFDQPAAELDPAGRRAIYENIHRLNRDEGKTIILVEDRLNEVAHFATRIVLMDRGKIIREQPPREFFADPVVEEHGLRIPDSVRIYHLLRNRGISLDRLPLTVDEAVATVTPLLRSVRPHAVRLDDLAFSESKQDASGQPEGVPRVQVEGLVHRYATGVMALKGVNLTVMAGEFLAIVGENGAGKTTLAKHLVGLLRPTEGSVRILGHDISGLPVDKISRWVGYLFQDPDFQIFNNSCLEEVAYGLKLRKLSPQQVREQAETALDLLDLADHCDEHPYTLSRGQRQRLAVASVIAMNPPVMVVDEPSSGLDYRQTLAMMQLLQEFRQKGGAVIIITHDMDMAVRFADRIVVMADGNIVHDLPTADIIGRLGELEQSAIILPDAAMIGEKLGLPAALWHTSGISEAVCVLAGKTQEERAGEGRRMQGSG